MIWLRLLLIPLFSILNHLRGGGGYFGLDTASLLPGRPIFYAAPIAGLLAWPSLGWLHALLFAATYLLWGIPEWGRWFSLNRSPRAISGAPGWWAKILERFADRIPLGQIVDSETGMKRNDYACFTIRNTVLLAPLALISPWLALLGPLQTLAYTIGWTIKPKVGSGIPPSELVFGAFIGAFLFAVS